MPPRRILSTPPETPPRRPLADASNLTQDLSPSNSPSAQRSARARIQATLNAAAEADTAKDERIAELENQLATAAKPRKRRRYNREEDAPQDVVNPVQLAAQVTHLGRRYASWAASSLFRPLSGPVKYTQGQVNDIVESLPEAAKARWPEDWLAGSFRDGLENQRTIMRNRTSAPATPASPTSPTSSGTALARRSAAAHYSPFKAEVLYDEYNGSVDLEHLFKSSTLLKIYAAVLRGPDGPEGLMERKPHKPDARYNQRTYRVTHTTPGAIASCAVLAIFLFSADPQFVEKGHVTSINYRKRFIVYVSKIRLALLRGHSWARNLLRYWDSYLFPDSDDVFDGTVVGNQQAEAEEMEEDEEVFNNAEVAASQQPSPAQSPEPQRQPTPPPPPPNQAQTRSASRSRGPRTVRR
ncbi:hypothetical protein HMN09_00850900 [Mycena chlorophos]|uniref:Uncharacterized protein n=1 Tax=Mycena chlorophos TaxID=658473 RepID=A0A8H6W6B4_MYCCL|nr:hypothetical protein HMN09_00850900 [Mycena chlorophos]